MVEVKQVLVGVRIIGDTSYPRSWAFLRYMRQRVDSYSTHTLRSTRKWTLTQNRGYNLFQVFPFSKDLEILLELRKEVFRGYYWLRTRLQVEHLLFQHRQTLLHIAIYCSHNRWDGSVGQSGERLGCRLSASSQWHLFCLTKLPINMPENKTFCVSTCTRVLDSGTCTEGAIVTKYLPFSCSFFCDLASCSVVVKVDLKLS